MTENKKTLYLLNEIIKKESNNKEILGDILAVIKKLTEAVPIEGWVEYENNYKMSLEQVRKTPILEKIDELEKKVEKL